jgi:hypothetical protein
MKPEHKNRAFDGTMQELKVIIWELTYLIHWESMVNSNSSKID